jgi:hypothetical protein
MLRRYCPPTSSSACEIEPSDATLTFSMSAAKTLPLLAAARCSSASAAGLLNVGKKAEVVMIGYCDCIKGLLTAGRDQSLRVSQPFLGRCV